MIDLDVEKYTHIFRSGLMISASARELDLSCYFALVIIMVMAETILISLPDHTTFPTTNTIIMCTLYKKPVGVFGTSLKANSDI